MHMILVLIVMLLQLKTLDLYKYLMKKNGIQYKIFGFIKKVFIAAMTFFSFNILNINSLECVSMNNQEYKVRPKIINTNNNEPVFYLYSVKISKCSRKSGKHINAKLFNLMSKINETRQMIWHETCKCVCRLTKSVCNSRQIWNRCRCKCKELVDKGICDKGFIWNPRNCQCKCDKPCGIGEYLDYRNCVCRNSIVNKLIEECTDVIDENKIYNETLNTIPSDDFTSCTLYIVLFAVFLTTSVVTGCSFIYFHWYRKNKQLDFKKDVLDAKYSKTETLIY